MDALCRIRAAGLGDLDGIVAIERASFSDPWSAASLREALTAPGSISLIAEEDGQAVGYAVARTIAGQAEILTLGVLPRSRRRGLGRALVERLLGALQARGIGEVWLEVRFSNHPAQQLYRSFGFRPGGMRRAYYRHPTEDALVYRLVLAPDRA